MKKKIIALAVAMVLTISAVIGGTLAWLQTTSNDVVNTFTFGNIQIKLDETDTDDGTSDAGRDAANTYELIPGDKAVKDPKVTVLANSENCYVFIKISESNNTLGSGKIINYEVNPAWACVDEDNKIYVYGSATAGKSIPASIGDFMIPASILADKTVTVDDATTTYNIWVNEALTKETIAAMAGTTESSTDDSYPELSFTACAVQSDNITFEQAKNIALGLLVPASTTTE